MKRYRQSVDQIIDSLSIIEASWRDNHALAVIDILNSIPDKEEYDSFDIL